MGSLDHLEYVLVTYSWSSKGPNSTNHSPPTRRSQCERTIHVGSGPLIKSQLSVVLREHIEHDLRPSPNGAVKSQLVRHVVPAVLDSTYVAKLSNRRSSALRYESTQFVTSCSSADPSRHWRARPTLVVITAVPGWCPGASWRSRLGRLGVDGCRTEVRLDDHLGLAPGICRS